MVILRLELKEIIIHAINEGKNLEEIEIPKLEFLEIAYKMADAESTRTKAYKFIDHCLYLLKRVSIIIIVKFSIGVTVLVL